MKLKIKMFYFLTISIATLILISLSVTSFLVDSTDVTTNITIGNIDVKLYDISNNNFNVSLKSPTYFLDIENPNYNSEQILKNIAQFNESTFFLPVRINNNSNVNAKVDFFKYNFITEGQLNGICYVILPGSEEMISDNYNYIKSFINSNGLVNFNDLQSELQRINNQTINELVETNFTQYNLNIIFWDEYYETWDNDKPSSRYDGVFDIKRLDFVFNVEIKLRQADYYDGY